MANPNVTFRNARRVVGFSAEHMERKRENENQRLAESPFVAIMNRVAEGTLSAEEGAAEVRRLLNTN